MGNFASSWILGVSPQPSLPNIVINKASAAAMAEDYARAAAAMDDDARMKNRDFVFGIYPDVQETSTISDAEGLSIITKSFALRVAKDLAEVAAGMEPGEILTFDQYQARLAAIGAREIADALKDFMVNGNSAKLNELRALAGRGPAEDNWMYRVFRPLWLIRR